LGGVFAKMATMKEVCAAGGAISSVAEHCYWNIRMHLHKVCTPSQRQVIVRKAVLQLPGLPGRVMGAGARMAAAV
jgi:hypothetical protein